MISHDHPRFSDPDYDPDRLTGLDEYDGPDYAQELRDELRDDARVKQLESTALEAPCTKQG